MIAASSEPPGLAFKAYEIEEWIDVHFFRRTGIAVARAARRLGLSPNAVSVVSGLCGMLGGLLLISDPWVPLGVTLIVSHGIFDSADGQLARMTGQTSEWGRVLDGAGGYVTHAAAYSAIVVRVITGGGSWAILPLGVAAGAMTAIHAQMYDYHRARYASVVLKGVARAGAAAAPAGSNAVTRAYEAIQRATAGLHPAVEAALAGRAGGGSVAETDRARYRRAFYRPVRAWNLFGDNVRRLAFVVLAWWHRLDLYFVFILVPLTAGFAAVWLWQRRVDARELAFYRGTASSRASVTAER